MAVAKCYGFGRRTLFSTEGSFGCFHRETKARFRKRVVLANVPSFRCSFRENMRTYPRSVFRSGGTSQCTLVPVFVPVEHPPKPPFWKTTLLSTPIIVGRRSLPLWNQTPHETTFLLHLAGRSLVRNLDSCCSWKSPPKMTFCHVGCVSCRVTSWREFVDPNLMKDREAVVSRWVCGFMLGLERILWCLSCCFVSGLCLWFLVHWNSLLWKRQNTTSFSAFSAMAWTEQNMLFHVGLGFRVGFAGAQMLKGGYKRFSEKVFVSQERVSGFPDKGADLQGSPGNFWVNPGNFRGTSGLLLSSTVRELSGKSPGNFREVRGFSGEVRGLSRSSGEPDSLSATRQICLQDS